MTKKDYSNQENNNGYNQFGEKDNLASVSDSEEMRKQEIDDKIWQVMRNDNLSEVEKFLQVEPYLYLLPEDSLYPSYRKDEMSREELIKWLESYEEKMTMMTKFYISSGLKPGKKSTKGVEDVKKGTDESIVEAIKTTDQSEITDRVLMINVKHLKDENPIAFYELVMKARDPNHQFWDNSITEVLKNLALVQSDGNLHDITRDFLLKHVSGDGLEMKLK